MYFRPLITSVLAVAISVVWLSAVAWAGADALAESIRLWPADAPGALGSAEADIPVVAWWPAVEIMAAKTAAEPAVSVPAKASAAVVICPGGRLRWARRSRRHRLCQVAQRAGNLRICFALPARQ